MQCLQVIESPMSHHTSMVQVKIACVRLAAKDNDAAAAAAAAAVISRCAPLRFAPQVTCDIGSSVMHLQEVQHQSPAGVDHSLAQDLASATLHSALLIGCTTASHKSCRGATAAPAPAALPTNELVAATGRRSDQAATNRLASRNTSATQRIQCAAIKRLISQRTASGTKHNCGSGERIDRDQSARSTIENKGDNRHSTTRDNEASKQEDNPTTDKLPRHTQAQANSNSHRRKQQNDQEGNQAASKHQ